MISKRFLTDVSYSMDMSCGGDSWRIRGRDKERGVYVFPSVPVSFDRKRMSFKTLSGSEYVILDLSMNKNEFIAHIEKDIQAESFEVH